MNTEVREQRCWSKNNHKMEGQSKRNGTEIVAKDVVRATFSRKA